METAVRGQDHGESSKKGRAWKKQQEVRIMEKKSNKSKSWRKQQHHGEK
jgi:hypothetical protein